MNIIYSAKITDRQGSQFSNKLMKEIFKEAIEIHRKLVYQNKKIAYFFIDPLLNSFEAANQFYFGLFECVYINKINTYKSGASPIQALADAKELLDSGLYDVVFIFGYEPLLTNKRTLGKHAIAQAMSIFENHSIIECYNETAHKLCKELGLSTEEFVGLSDQLFLNYYKTYQRESRTKVSLDRGRPLNVQGADLFKLTDCANPNIDFAGGIILANDATTKLLQIPIEDQIQVSGVNYRMVEGSPEKLDTIVGKQGNLFPHLRQAFLSAEEQSKIDVVEEFKKGNLYLEVYTCYPPIPIAFLIASGMIKNIDELSSFLECYEITITGGMSLARAPWNNPALNGIIEMCEKLKQSTKTYGLVHGNGGIGEVQGIALFERIKK